MKTNKYYLRIYNYPKPLVSMVISIPQTIDRPNNPEDYEIIDAYVFYHYGHNKFDCDKIEEEEIIGEDWNIENYK